MRFLLASIWDDFSNWVTVGWSDLTFIIVVSVFGILALSSILGFLKGNKYNRDKKPFKWGSLVMTLICFGILAVLFAAKYA